jgi:hypothetical protein
MRFYDHVFPRSHAHSFFPGFARNLSVRISLRDERGRFRFYIEWLVHESVVRAYDTQGLTQYRSKSFLNEIHLPASRCCQAL